MNIYYNYDTNKFDFRKELQGLYGIDNLSLLHELDGKYDIGQIGNDTHTRSHNMFYDKLHNSWPEIQDIYLRLIKEFIFPLLNEGRILYQTFPSFRVHLTNNKAVTTWHYDADELHCHPPHEINWWLPITPAFDTNTMWVEETQGIGDFVPIECDYGTIVRFPGNTHIHGNKINTTGKTRISFDFRVLPYSKYDPMYSKISATSKLRFVDGEYYKSYSGE